MNLVFKKVIIEILFFFYKNKKMGQFFFSKFQ